MRSGDLLFRLATREDLPSIVRLLADDDLGSQRERYENPLPEPYYSAFEEIRNDPKHELIVAERDGEVIGTLHLIFLPSISFQGGLRAQVEAVRVDRRFQSQGIGSEMMKQAAPITAPIIEPMKAAPKARLASPRLAMG